jgi:hypothetical protein
MRPFAFALVIALLAGCGAQEDTDVPGIRGPVVFRLWDRAARASGQAPVVIRTDAVHQKSAAFDDLEMVPVLIRRPLADGVLWIHAPQGTFQSAGDSGPGRKQQASLQGPVHLTGTISGLPVSGSAATAIVPPGRQVLELTDVRLVRGGMVLSTPRSTLSDGELQMSGPVELAPGSPAMTAVLGAAF